MTPEFGAASQLEKIDMLDFADVVAINKFERRGAEDARRDVARQLVRNRGAFGADWRDMPVFGTSAARFADDGVTALYGRLHALLEDQGLPRVASCRGCPDTYRRICGHPRARPCPVPVRCRGHGARVPRAHPARPTWHTGAKRCGRRRPRSDTAARTALVSAAADLDVAIDPRDQELLDSWPETVRRYGGDELIEVSGSREVVTPVAPQHLAGTQVPRVALPQLRDDGDVLSWLRRENLPGRFPSRPGFSRSNERRRTRRGCSPVKGSVPDQPPLPPAVRTPRRRGCRPRSTR